MTWITCRQDTALWDSGHNWSKPRRDRAAAAGNAAGVDPWARWQIISTCKNVFSQYENMGHSMMK
ncbi:hypothetical protein NtRootA9_31350 [Arthrobacter sp. NtRootA9]|nr:hypothetical protein NtRootA9_31350 [Arthrobacter sp. NtRootA9]